MAYEPRTYRGGMGADRFRPFTVVEGETDLWIGVDAASYRSAMERFVRETVKRLRGELSAWIARDRAFVESFSPIAVPEVAPEPIRSMAAAAQRAGVGPMAAVAGAIAETAGRALMVEFNGTEVVVENGGDIWAQVVSPLTVSVYAGSSPLSRKVGIVVPPELSPMGICTSSGTVGHSFSFGKADAAMICCRDTALADAFATAFCNRVKSADDIEPQLTRAAAEPEILSALFVVGDTVGVRGKFELTPISRIAS
ncbi:MAG TPA: UPF0280 family protein [bacterium]|nr:UPF0280 family protein [bacterium]